MSVCEFPAVAVVGPTGAGKSDLALALAERFTGEIVNFDSVQVYRGLDVGSAKVPLPERRGVPHHLIDVIAPDDELTAGAFARLAREVLGELRARQRLPILVGGTGLYLRALVDGLSPAPERDEELRSRLRGLQVARPAVLHRFLRWRDPAAAERIHANDCQKLIRAIEMMVLAGRTATELQAESRRRLEGVRVLKIGLAPDRRKLCERLDERSAQLFSAGLLQETRALLEAGVPPDAKPLQTIGYRQAVGVISGTLSLEAAIRECQARTRQYAKRQMTWFRQSRDVYWIPGFGADPQVQSTAKLQAAEFLQKTRC